MHNRDNVKRNEKNVEPIPAAPLAEIESQYQRLRSVVRDTISMGIKAATNFFSRRPVALDLLTYDDVMNYFSDHRPKDQRIAKGLILKKPDRNGWFITQCFLDADDTPLKDPDNDKYYGRQIVTEKLDPDLENLFGTAESVTLE